MSSRADHCGEGAAPTTKTPSSQKWYTNVSKRVMYHRQTDALALLYISNDDMGRARDYFDRAKQTFDSKGLEKLSSQTEKLKDQIF